MDEKALERAKNQAMKMLARRARSEREVRARLERSHFPQEIVEGAVARLKELRFLDDASYARQRAEALLLQGHWGPCAVIYRLISQGIGEEMAATAARQAQGTLSERELAARCLAAKRLPAGPPASLAQKARAARYLAARGFGEQAIEETLTAPAAKE
jgi:regulatory protein